MVKIINNVFNTITHKRNVPSEASSALYYHSTALLSLTSIQMTIIQMYILFSTFGFLFFSFSEIKKRIRFSFYFL